MRIFKMLNKKPNMTREQVESVLLLYNNGKIEEAINTIKELNESYPNVPLLFNLLGACYQSLSNFDAAMQMFQTATKLKPDYAEAYFNQGVVFKHLSKLDESIKAYKKAIALNPNYPDAHNNLGNLYKEIGNRDDAIESYEWAIAYRPDFEITHLNLGVLYSEFDQEVAIKHYQKAIAIKPGYSEAHYNLGSTLRHLGRKADSIKSYEKAIEFNPHYVDAHKNLSAMKEYKKDDPQISQMKLLLSNKNLAESDKVSLNFALSKVYEDLNNQNDFFKFLHEGNKLRKEELNYSFDDDYEMISKIREVFMLPHTKTKQSSYKTSEIKPIFIVGMPRSGTSLVEQIISSHHSVYGAGELEFLAQNSYKELKKHYASTNNVFSEKSFLYIRERYLESLSNLNVSESIITDKMPLNFRFIGFILSAFPDAKIVHLNRDARATCWSIYKYYFKSDGNGYSYNLQDLVSYYCLYDELMKFWHKLYPNQIYDISYEDLTTNQENETRNLLEYCGLDWDDNCINFHTNKRAVKTTSALQVKEKMYQGSSEVWKKYESHIQPLIKGLSSF